MARAPMKRHVKKNQLHKDVGKTPVLSFPLFFIFQPIGIMPQFLLMPSADPVFRLRWNDQS